MLKIHDHFDLKVRAELAAEAPGHLERGVLDQAARGNFLFQHRVGGTARLLLPGGCRRLGKRSGAGDPSSNEAWTLSPPPWPQCDWI